MWLLKPAHKHIGQDTLSEHLDGRLRGRPLERVERQLGECDACRQDLAELQATVAMMRQLPMETPSRSFVMDAPPPEPVRARPALALRAPNWVYAGAASVAALALAITVSVDATGGLSSEPPPRDVVTTALAATAASEQTTGISGPPSSPGPAAESAIESASRSEAASGSGEDEAAPLPLAAAAPAPATTDQPAQGEPAGGEATASGAERAPVAPAAPESAAPPVEAAAAASQDGERAISADAPEDSVAAGGDSAAGATATIDNQIAEQATIAEPAEAPVPIPETAGPELFDQGDSGDTSAWWRVLEAAAGALAVVFLAGLALRWRTNRHDAA